jgi:thiamine biosynthesis lipoprotein
MKRLVFILLLTVILLGCENQSQNDPFTRSTISMGTSLEIKIHDIDEDTGIELTNLVVAEAQRLNDKYSTYKDDNFMAWLNNSTDDIIEVDSETYYLLKKCDEIHKLTGGGFDPAVGNIIDLLGFEKGSPNLPEKEQIDSVLKEVGWKHVQLLGDNKLRKLAHIKLNFGGIVKGYAVDRMYEILDSALVRDFLINFGGEVKAKGENWSIGIQHPRIKNELLGVLKLNRIGSATSGDYERFFKKDNKRYNHIINPVTGYPADECMSVTIIGESMTDADGYATGVFVMGTRNGLNIIESIPEIEGMIVDTAGNVFKSTGFDKNFRSR